MPHSRKATIWALLALSLALAGCMTVATPELISPVVTEAGPGSSPLPSDTPPAYPAPPTVQSEPTYTPPYPPPPTQAGPMPSVTPTATPWSVSSLPPLPTYPPPGLFSEMKIIYRQELEGFKSLSVDGLGRTALELPLGMLTPDSIQVSPDGRKILYWLWNGQNWSDAEIWVMDPDGTNRQLLVDSSEDAYPQAAIWSPDGNQIAFLKAYRPSEIWKFKEVWIMNADGSEQHVILSDPQASIIGVYPDTWFWARNGYIYSSDAQLEQLYAINPLNGAFYRLMDAIDPVDARFALSPDGVHAATYDSFTLSRTQNADFTAVEILGRDLSWSADGSNLAYHNEQGIWLRDVVSGENELIVPDISPYEAHLGGISPDNRYVAYQTDKGIFIVDLSDPGSQPKLVVEDPHTLTGNKALRFRTWLPTP